ncbi:MAG: T9SS type A sorting domain-containing protein [Bacteroidota bacterium]
MKLLTPFFFKAIFIFFIAANSFAQIPEWLWAKQSGNAGYTKGSSITKDSSGNMYIVGNFNISISFGSDTAFSLPKPANDNSHDIFIAKFNSDGNNLWTKSQGGTGNLYEFDIIRSAADKNGNLYISGTFSGDSITFGTYTLYGVRNYQEIFIVKYNSEGNVLWARSAGGKSDDDITSIATDNDGNVFLGGYFRSDSIKFGAKTLTRSSSASTYQPSFFIAKYDPEGNVLWANSAIANGSMVNSIVTDRQGNLYIFGNFSGAYLKLNTEISLTAKSGNNYNLFLAKYDGNGNVLWGRAFLSDGYSYSNIVTIDNYNNTIYLVGKHAKPVTFDTVTLGVNTFMYIVKYDLNGNMIWAKTDTEATGNCTALVTDNSGNVYMAGDYITQITFGDTTLYNYGAADIFLAKYDRNGNAQWARSMGGIKEDVCNGIVLNKDNSLYILGTFSSPELYIESTVLKNYDSTLSTSWDIIFAKLGSISTGISDESKGQDFPAVFPNPTHGSFKVSVPEGNWHIRVYSLEGVAVYNTNITGSEIKIDLSAQPKGIYIYQLQKDNKIVKTGKLILE